ncbi:endolytic transglycosylase MltG [uncultured Cutibacterium sp.]|uniref:endolytic transglycosylase MltG n=1 Tax=uncultured Cutibacterium sp. TaxID=1912223 RepID=UPI0025934CB4|nr:endolytic transglycosylase MltG [uncultured Cutibacterium sp.]
MSGPFNEHDDPKAEFWYKLRSAVAVILSLAVLVGGCVFVGVKVYDGYISYKSADDYLGDGDKDILVRVPAGASVSEVGSILLNNDVVKSTKAYNKALRDSESDVTIQAGQYKLKTHMNAAKAVSILGNADNIQRTRVTLPEGLSAEQQFGIMAKGTTMPASSFKSAYQQTAKLDLPVWANGHPEGFLFPDTYEVGSNPTPLEILQMQTNQFAKQVNTMNFIGQAQAIKRTPYEALTVASILEKEAKKPKDMRIVAGIIYNRLNQGMKLESDATVLYANHAEGKLTTTSEQRAKQSPYNTYLVNGLPPTPISNPGTASMEAAVTPIKTDYLYWVVTDPDKGTTAYSKTLAEHEKNVKKFHAWCQAHKGKC